VEGEPTYDAAMNHAEAFSLEESYDAFPRIEAEFEGALDASLGPRGPELLYELVQGLHLAPRANVLDVGCGEGRHSLTLAERFGFSVHGVDPVPRHIELSTERLDAAAARRPELRELVRFHRGSTESLPLDDRTIDLIWCRDVLVHVFALETAFTEWRRVLRDDGRAIVFQTLATDRLEPREAAWLFATLGIAVGSTDPKRVDESIAAGGLRIDRRIDLGHDWATFNEEQAGRSTRKLLHAARLLQDPDRYVARFGRSAYEIELGDCLWHVFHMIGKLTDRAYLLSKQP